LVQAGVGRLLAVASLGFKKLNIYTDISKVKNKNKKKNRERKKERKRKKKENEKISGEPYLLGKETFYTPFAPLQFVFLPIKNSPSSRLD
jgi:hypothetical protein